jgi:hypothetical protein
MMSNSGEMFPESPKTRQTQISSLSAGPNTVLRTGYREFPWRHLRYGNVHLAVAKAEAFSQDAN